MILWLPVVLTLCFCYVQSETCITPKGEFGQCQRIRDCGLLWDLAVKTKPTHKEVYYLRKSACGFKQTMPKVCCPDVWNVNECKLTASPPDPRSGCCGIASSDSDKIVGGTLAQIDAYPWMGVIEFQKEIDGNFRNAVLISGKYVISVAHCLTKEFARKVGRPTIIRFGEFDLANKGPDCVEVDGGGTDCNEGSFSISVANVLAHPQYNASGHNENDIALIRLSQTAPFTDFIRPICLPSSDITSGSGNQYQYIQLITAGWGSIAGRASKAPVMRYYNSPYMETKVCAAIATKISKEKKELKNTQICAIVQGREKNDLDFGGPLLYNNRYYSEIAGISSYALGRGLPDVFTKVFEYRPWILQNIKP